MIADDAPPREDVRHCVPPLSTNQAPREIITIVIFSLSQEKKSRNPISNPVVTKTGECRWTDGQN